MKYFNEKKGYYYGMHLPRSNILYLPVHQFNNDYIVPLLGKIFAEDYAPLWVTLIDLLKSDNNEDVNTFYNSMNSRFFAPYILQPTRPKSKSLIDNMLINSVEFLLQW